MPATNNVIEVIVSLVDKATAPLAGLTRSVGRFKGLAAAALGGWTPNDLSTHHGQQFIAIARDSRQMPVKADT